MIAFDLQCSCGCRFEGWFDSREDFNQQQEGGLICCPHCDGREIRKILSPVSIRKNYANKMEAQPANVDVGQQIVDFFKSVQTYVEKNFEDVGAGFAEESLKIHYGVNEPRNIRGVTTAEEEKMLEKEGVDLVKVPIVSDKPDPDYN